MSSENGDGTHVDDDSSEVKAKRQVVLKVREDRRLTPDQSCLGLIIGIGLLLLTILCWGTYYWIISPELHPVTARDVPKPI